MIIGLVGLAGSGKDTVADMLQQHHGFTKVALADPLKRIARDVFAFTDEQLWGPSQNRNTPDQRYPRFDHNGHYAGHLTPRHALQTLGTEWGRECYADTWIEMGIRIARELLTPNGGRAYDAKVGIFRASCPPPEGVVFSDCRFKNEIDAVHDAGGKVIRIVRPGAGLGGAAGLHPSEVEQASIKDEAFDLVLHNAGTLEDLRENVRGFVESLLSAGR